MSEYQRFVDSIADEVEAFEARKTISTAKEEARETELLRRWQARKKEEAVQEEQSSTAYVLGRNVQVNSRCASLRRCR